MPDDLDVGSRNYFTAKSGGNMRKVSCTVLLMFACLTFLNAQTTRDSSHVVPTGKGWGVDANASGQKAPRTVVQGNGISYHGGPVLKSTPSVYFIWYGNWSNGAHPSDSQTTVSLLDVLFGSTGLNGSGYERINTTYGDNSGNVTGNIVLSGSTTDNYSRGTRLRDADIKTIVSSAITSGRLPSNTNALYFVLTSSDVRETSGFCSQYCGWHTHGSINGADIKYSFVGNPDRCPSACEAETNSPNGDSGADGMASVMAHEAEETLTDPDLNAWYDSSGAENADKCAWKFGPTTGAVGSGGYNQTLGSKHWLIQMNWENSRGGGCDQTLGGAFYTR
jgi:Phosphate-induced protein 1 conserved region